MYKQKISHIMKHEKNSQKFLKLIEVRKDENILQFVS